MPDVPPGTRVVYSPPGREKMSDVLKEFVEPFSEQANTEDSYSRLLTLGMVAWNAALQPEDKRQAFVDNLIAAGFSESSPMDRAMAYQIIAIMIERKLKYFANIHRAIMSFNLTDTGDGFHLSVASTL